MTASFARGGAWILGILMITACGGDEAAEPVDSPNTEQTPAAGEAEVQDRGTPEEARAMLDRAVAHYQDVGREQALRDFTAKTAPFVDRDLYVFCYGPDRRISAHGADSTIVGDAVDELRDVDGFAFGPAIMDSARVHADGAEVAYKWLNPLSGMVESKVSFVRMVGDDVCGVGAYEGT